MMYNLSIPLINAGLKVCVVCEGFWIELLKLVPLKRLYSLHMLGRLTLQHQREQNVLRDVLGSVVRSQATPPLLSKSQ